MNKFGCEWKSEEAARAYSQIVAEYVRNGVGFGDQEGIARLVRLADQLVQCEGFIPDNFLVSVDLGIIYSSAGQFDEQDAGMCEEFLAKAARAWSIASNYVENGQPKATAGLDSDVARISYMRHYRLIPCQIGFARYLRSDGKELRHLADIKAQWEQATWEDPDDKFLKAIGKHIHEDLMDEHIKAEFANEERVSGIAVQDAPSPSSQVTTSTSVDASLSRTKPALQMSVPISRSTHASPSKIIAESGINKTFLMIGGATVILLLVGGVILYSKIQKEKQLKVELVHQEQQLRSTKERALAAEAQQRREAEKAQATFVEAEASRAEAQQLPAESQASQAFSGDHLDAPLTRIEDTYTYETIDHIEAKLNNVTIREVVNVSGNELTMKYVNAKSGYTRFLTFDSSLGLLSSRSQNDEGVNYRPAFKYFSFPSRVGDTWDASSIETNIKTGKTRIHSVRGRVEGIETVTVPGGTFRAWKISIKSEVRDGSKIMFGQDISWYSPEARRTVKSELESREGDTGKIGRRTVSLLSYSLRP